MDIDDIKTVAILGGFLAFVGVGGGLVCGVKNSPYKSNREIYSGKINNSKVSYYEGRNDILNGFGTYPVLKIYDGQKCETFIDYNKDGIIGNNSNDEYIITDDSAKKKVEYAKGFIKQFNGKKSIDFKECSYDSSGIYTKLRDINKQKLDYATKKYADYKSRVTDSLISRLR